MGFAVIGSKSIPQLERLAHGLAQDTAAIVILPHATLRMKQRRVSEQAVFECLQHGRILETPEPNTMKGSLEIRMTYYIAGRTVRMVAALRDEAPDLLVITVIA